MFGHSWKYKYPAVSQNLRHFLCDICLDKFGPEQTNKVTFTISSLSLFIDCTSTSLRSFPFIWETFTVGRIYSPEESDEEKRLFCFLIFFLKLILSLCFHHDISQKLPRMVLFVTYQGYWGHQYSFMSFAEINNHTFDINLILYD